ncbi:MAG: hypothetical protein K0S05_2685 [Agromyces sp.]|nr:hypothetical protein [Agromyces sp.]
MPPTSRVAASVSSCRRWSRSSVANMSTRTVGSAVTTTGLAVLLVGCAGGAGPSPSPTTAPATETSTPTSTPTPTDGPVDPNAPAGQCADDALRVSISAADSGAGSSYYELSFTNTGDSACELRGAPGVSVVDASGTQLGEAADRIDDDAPPTLTVEPGASVTATLQATNIEPDGGPLDDCPVVYGTGYLVYPPHSFTAVLVETSDPVPACESSTVFLHVGPVQQPS